MVNVSALLVSCAPLVAATELVDGVGDDGVGDDGVDDVGVGELPPLALTLVVEELSAPVVVVDGVGELPLLVLLVKVLSC
jgi:hypothetical protein